MPLHPTTFEYLKPTPAQILQMATFHKANGDYCRLLELELPDSPDKTFILRELRSLAMWINVAITRQPDGAPRQ
jgi:hypothetical protein